MELTRRNALVGGAAAVVAAAACGTALAEDAQFDAQYDVLVIGAGFGGMVTASRVAETGASVAIMEASANVGGTGLMSSGTLGYLPANPTTDLSLADPDLLECFDKGWNGLMAWFSEIDAPINQVSATMARLGVGTQTPDGNYMVAQWLKEYMESLGIAIMMQTRAFELIEQDGTVIGAKAHAADGSVISVGAKVVVLACGGIIADKNMCREAYGQWGDLLATRSDPYCDGAAIRMACKVGAAISKSMSTFYGHHLSWPFIISQSAENWDANAGDVEWLALQNSIMSNIQGFGSSCVFVNQEGKRYQDESLSDNDLAQYTARQTFARAYVILDSAIRAAAVAPNSRSGVERMEILKENGAIILEAATIEELADQLAAKYGVHKANFLKTIAGYNEACKAGTTADLEIPKAAAAKAIAVEQGPFYAIPTVPGVSLCFGGVKIDKYCHVISVENKVIPGLCALVGTAGGMHYYTMLGGLSSICSSAYVAADTIIAAL